METELIAKFDGRKSFYKKAFVQQQEGSLWLRSYDTIVAVYHIKGEVLELRGWFSATTARHIREFATQLGFDTISIEEMRAGLNLKLGGER